MPNEQLVANEGYVVRKTVDDFSNWVGLKTRDGMHQVDRIVGVEYFEQDNEPRVLVEFIPDIYGYSIWWARASDGCVFHVHEYKWIDLTPIQEPQFDYPETALVQDEKPKQKMKVYLYEGNVAFSAPLLNSLTPIGSAWVIEGEFADD